MAGRKKKGLKNVVHVLHQVSLLSWWTFKLLAIFRPPPLPQGVKWVFKFIGIFLYQLFLLPGFAQIGYYYFTSQSVLRSVVYGTNPRNRLDLFVPPVPPPKGGYPVVVFVTGGVWIIGYKGWGALLGKCLSAQGVMVASLDYRNFPQGTVSDMVQDVTQGVAWCMQNVSRWGGNANNILFMGQSAGAHLSALTLMHQVELAGTGRCQDPAVQPWPALPAVKCWVGLSGGYMLDKKLTNHFNKRGLYSRVFYAIMEAGFEGRNVRNILPLHSPEAHLASAAFEGGGATALLPKMVMLHGSADRSMPLFASKSFHKALLAAGARSTLKIYDGKSHTDAFIEDPMTGGHDQLLRDVLVALYEEQWEQEGLTEDEQNMKLDEMSYIAPLLPGVVVDLARIVMPF